MKTAQRCKHHRAFRLVKNVFCPTGEGGGVDPTCSPTQTQVNSSPVSKQQIKDAYKLLVSRADIPSAVGYTKKSVEAMHESMFLPVQQELIKRGYTVRLNHAETTHSSYLNISMPSKETPSGMKVAGEIRISDHAIHGRTGNNRTKNGDSYYHSIMQGQSNQKIADRLNNALKDFPSLSQQQIVNARRIRTKTKRNPLRGDPTRTATLRRKFLADLNSRFAILKKRLRKLIVEDDAFGLNRLQTNVFCPTGEGGGVDPTCSPSGVLSQSGDQWTSDFSVGKISYQFLAEKLPGMSSAWEIIFFVKEESLPTDKKQWEGTEVTGTGNPVQVFSKVLGILQRFASEQRPRDLFFTATEPSRKRLYDKMADRLKLAGYRRIDNADKTIYHYVKTQTTNVFCPTGEGGGIDPSCGKEDSSWEDSLSEDEIDAIQSYTLDSDGINAKMRRGFSDGDSNIDSALSKSFLPKDMIVYRGVQFDPELSVGTFMTERAYLSASTNQGTAEDFADNFGQSEDGVLFVLSVKKGSPIAKLSQKLSPSYASEGEYLGAKNSKMVVTKIEVASSGRKIYFGDVIFPTTIVNAERFEFQTSAQKVEAFRRWLKQQMTMLFVQEAEDKARQDWFQKYVEEGYRQGAGRAFDDTRKPYIKEVMKDLHVSDFYRGTKDEFLRSSFGQPVAVEKVKLLTGRVFTDLKGISDSMSTKLVRTLTEGLVQGKSPRNIARDIDEDIEGIDRSRANAIARTEIIRTHAEGQLDAFENLGVTDVGVAAEWSTAGDEKVCELCSPLEGVVMKVEEARGLLPRHPNCFISPKVPIYTSYGWKPLGDIRVGDLVLSHNGRFKKVLQVHRNRSQSEAVTTFRIKWNNTEITLTDKHPLLINGSWQPVEVLKVGDKVHWLSSTCVSCGKPLPSRFKYCDVHCQWKNKEHRRLISNKAKKQMRKSYATGERDGKAITRAAHARVRQLIEFGQFDHERASGECNGAKQPAARKKISESKRGDKNPMRMYPAIGKANGQKLAKYIKDHPEKHANHICAQKGRITGIEESMRIAFNRCKLFPVFQHHLNGMWIDFAFPQHKIAIECDGEYWHRDVEAQKKRDKRIEALGWTVVHLTEQQIKESASSCAIMVKRLLNNHEGRFKFFEAEVTEVSHRITGPVTLYNLSVEEDESYLAKGCVVHNCRCAWLPANVGEDQSGQKNTKKQIDEALEESVELEGGEEKSKWLGADADVSKKRPESIL